MTAAITGERFSWQLSKTIQVITALFIRETRTRFGRNRLGYIWAIAEPIAYVTFFVVIRSQIRDVSVFGENLILFFLAGLLMFRVFMNIASRGMSALTANRSLMAYPPVRPTDVIFARTLLETLTMYVVVMVFFVFLTLTAETRIIYDHVAFASAMGGVTILAVGFATFNAVFSALMPFWEIVFRLIRMPAFILSGVFYLPKSLPPFAQDIIWWNPIIHCVEWMRTATYVTYEPFLSRWYVITVGVGLLATGLLLERIYRYRVLSG